MFLLFLNVAPADLSHAFPAIIRRKFTKESVWERIRDFFFFFKFIFIGRQCRKNYTRCGTSWDGEKCPAERMILPVARTGVRDMTNRHVVLFFFLFFTWPFVSVHSACPLANHERAVKCRLDSNWVGTSLWRTCFRVYLLLSVESCAGHFFDMRLSLLLFLHSSVFILVGQKFFRKKKVSKTRERETVKGEKYRKVACGSYYHYDQSDDRLLPATANKLMASPFLTCIICCLLPVSTSSFFFSSLLF